MKKTKFILSTITLLLFARQGMADFTFVTDQNAYTTFQGFLSLPESITKTYRGVDQNGKACEFLVQKSAHKITVTSPTIYFHSFSIPLISTQSFGGNFEGDELRMSYFIDMPYSGMFPHPHGQFGTDYDLKVTRDSNNNINSIYMRVADVQDLGFQILGESTCQF